MNQECELETKAITALTVDIFLTYVFTQLHDVERVYNTSNERSYCNVPGVPRGPNSHIEAENTGYSGGKTYIVRFYVQRRLKRRPKR